MEAVWRGMDVQGRRGGGEVRRVQRWASEPGAGVEAARAVRWRRKRIIAGLAKVWGASRQVATDGVGAHGFGQMNSLVFYCLSSGPSDLRCSQRPRGA